MAYDEVVDKLWRFIRGDMETAEFEQWVYGSDDLKAWLGNDLYLWCLGIPYHDTYKLWEFKQQLLMVMDGLAPRGCRCLTWPDKHKILSGMKEEWEAIGDRFSVLRNRTPWLSLRRCPTCGTAWYTALDSDGADYFLRRLDEAAETAILEEDRWPEEFDRLPIFWPNPVWLEHNGYASLAEWQQKNNL
jgi:hypothetical protein